MQNPIQAMPTLPAFIPAYSQESWRDLSEVDAGFVLVVEDCGAALIWTEAGLPTVDVVEAATATSAHEAVAIVLFLVEGGIINQEVDHAYEGRGY